MSSEKPLVLYLHSEEQVWVYGGAAPGLSSGASPTQPLTQVNRARGAVAPGLDPEEIGGTWPWPRGESPLPAEL